MSVVHSTFNPDWAVASYCGLKILAVPPGGTQSGLKLAYIRQVKFLFDCAVSSGRGYRKVFSVLGRASLVKP
jgi:hypothetical protein